MEVVLVLVSKWDIKRDYMVLVTSFVLLLDIKATIVVLGMLTW